ncbi:condensation domain-containing protein, partial [Nocardia farcinica]
VSLSLQNFVEPVLELPGLRVQVQDFQRDSAQFDLILDLRERFGPDGPGGVHGLLTYATDLFEPETAATLARRWVRLLHAVVADSDIALAEIDLLDDAERAELVPVR